MLFEVNYTPKKCQIIATIGFTVSQFHLKSDIF